MKIQKLYLDLTVWFLRASKSISTEWGSPVCPNFTPKLHGLYVTCYTKGTQCSILHQQVSRSMPPTNQDSPPYLILGEKGLLLKGLQVSLHEAV